MVTVEYMHICDYAFPAQNGKPGIIGIFDVINGTAFPLTHGFMAVAAQLRGSAHELVPFVLSLERPNGDVLQKIEGTIPVSADGGAFIGVSLINTVFPTEGRYQVKISSAGQTLISHPLHLKKALGASQPVIAGPIH